MTKSETFWIIENHVSRLHVATPNRQVLKMVFNLLNKWTKNRIFKIDRTIRKEIYRRALDTHEKNFSLYLQVMGGM